MTVVNRVSRESKQGFKEYTTANRVESWNHLRRQ
uniref:Uncharacterized protein n=1 Tax=Manihot esculenta TaxID=3983 RepID=A0A2C9UUR6_MANES